MKIGIKKLRENEWQVHIGNALVKMDQFSVALLNITLEHLLALEHGDEHSNLDSYIALGRRLKILKPVDLQKFITKVDTKDLLNLMLVARDAELNKHVIQNMGGILSKQFEADLAGSEPPDEETAKQAIRRVVEQMFGLEAEGQIEIVSEQTQYI
jgi:hypothetical protein